MATESFTKSDRIMLQELNARSIENNTLLSEWKRRLDNLESEDKVLHGRVSRLSWFVASLVGSLGVLAALLT